MLRRSFLQALALASLMLAFLASGQAQTEGPRSLIAQAIDEHRLVTLAGNTRPEANRQNDLGPVADDLHLDMYLQLKRSPQQDLAAQRFVESLTDKTSPNFHKWITTVTSRPRSAQRAYTGSEGCRSGNGRSLPSV